MDYREGVLHIGGVSTAEIAERFGTPVYVYDAASVVAQITKLTRAFGRLPFKPSYAMKANGNVAILRLVREHGFGCDAVSPGEIHLARYAGFAPEEIWFTCSNVSNDDLRAIPDPRIVVNVNSMSEVDRLLSVGVDNPVALRLNPDIGAGHHHDVVTAGGGVKFGIDLAEIETARLVVEDSGRKVVGLHAHIGSGVDTIGPLMESARRLLDVAAGFPNLRFINFGGGIGVPYRPGDVEFPVEEYGEALTAVANRYLRARDLTAILEPGRYIVAAAGTLLTRVTTKRVSAGSEWIGCDTGFNHLVRPSKYGAYHHIVNATRGSTGSLRGSYDPSRQRDEVVIAGNLCESSDVFTRDADGNPVTRPIDPARPGDLLALCDAGAYGFSMGSHYNARLLPAEVLVQDGAARLVRERQTLEDLTRGME